MRDSRQVLVLTVILGLAGMVTARQKIDLNDPLTVPRISQAEFQKLHASDGVLAVDVRQAIAFQSGHIPGAVGVPLPETERHVKELREKAKGRPIVTYCSCPSEHSSAEAALVLYKKGLEDVRALVGGFPDWVLSGGRVER